MDWTTFQPAGDIYTRIKEAAEQTVCGIFLFTKDDDAPNSSLRAPRDNVIFEAGHFAAAKGKNNTTVILETGARMPADLGGDIYIPLHDGASTKAVNAELRRGLEHIFGASIVQGSDRIV